MQLSKRATHTLINSKSNIVLFLCNNCKKDEKKVWLKEITYQFIFINDKMCVKLQTTTATQQCVSSYDCVPVSQGKMCVCEFIF